MTAIVLPDIDRSTIEELKRRIPDLSEIELNLPTRKEMSKTAKDVGKTAKDVGKTADEAIDRLLGRKRSPIWPWIAVAIALAAAAGAVAAWFAWFRRPTWESQSEPWTEATYEVDQTTMTSPTESVLDEGSSAAAGTSTSVGRTSTDEPAGSAPYPIEEA
jgi:hypothetical protein